MDILSAPGAEASDLAAMVASRLCHDLVSPLGAIGNGVELLQMTADPSPEMDLVAGAVAGAQARLRLFRLGFGAAAPGQTVSPADLAQAFAAFEAAGRITVTRALTSPLPRIRARRLALSALCAETALARGGTLTVQADGIVAHGPRLRIEPALWESLRIGQPAEGSTPASVHFVLLARSGPVSVDWGDDWLSLTP